MIRYDKINLVDDNLQVQLLERQLGGSEGDEGRLAALHTLTTTQVGFKFQVFSNPEIGTPSIPSTCSTKVLQPSKKALFYYIFADPQWPPNSKGRLVKGFFLPGCLTSSSLTWSEAQHGLHLFLDYSAHLVTKNLRFTWMTMMLMVIMMMKRKIKDQDPQAALDHIDNPLLHPPFTPYLPSPHYPTRPAPDFVSGCKFKPGCSCAAPRLWLPPCGNITFHLDVQILLSQS